MTEVRHQKRVGETGQGNCKVGMVKLFCQEDCALVANSQPDCFVLEVLEFFIKASIWSKVYSQVTDSLCGWYLLDVFGISISHFYSDGNAWVYLEHPWFAICPTPSDGVKVAFFNSRDPPVVHNRLAQSWAIVCRVSVGGVELGKLEPSIVSSTIPPIGLVVVRMLSGELNCIPVCRSLRFAIKTELVQSQMGAKAPLPYPVPYTWWSAALK